MSPTDITNLKSLASTSIVMPAVDKSTIVKMADDSNAEAKVAAFAKSQMAGLNVFNQITLAAMELVLWLSTLQTEYAKMERRRRGTDPFGVDIINDRLFKLAPFYSWQRSMISALVVGGIGMLLNTISATITGSGEIPSLVTAPWRAALWAFLPICGMLASHMMHATAVRDSVKRVVYWTLLATVLSCALAWSMVYVFAFPQDGVARVVTNVFEASTTETNTPLKALIAVQLIGEIAFGGAVGIHLEHLSTRGFAQHSTPNEWHVQTDVHQRDLLQDLSAATNLKGRVEDYERRYLADESRFVTQSLAYLKEAQLRLLVARGEATLHVITNV